MNAKSTEEMHEAEIITFDQEHTRAKRNDSAFGTPPRKILKKCAANHRSRQFVVLRSTFAGALRRTLPVWVLGTPAKRWTAGCSLRGPIPQSSARPSNPDLMSSVGTFVVLTYPTSRNNLSLLRKRARNSGTGSFSKAPQRGAFDFSGLLHNTPSW